MRVLKPGVAKADRILLGECDACGAIVEFTHGEAQSTGGPPFMPCRLPCKSVVVGFPEFSDEGARLRSIAENYAHGEVRAAER